LRLSPATFSWFVHQRPKPFEDRTAELIRFGFQNFDALHLASAEQVGVDTFASVDDQLLGLARRNSSQFKVRVAQIVELVREMVK